jgi:hypothetical protein
MFFPAALQFREVKKRANHNFKYENAVVRKPEIRIPLQYRMFKNLFSRQFLENKIENSIIFQKRAMLYCSVKIPGNWGFLN